MGKLYTPPTGEQFVEFSERSRGRSLTQEIATRASIVPYLTGFLGSLANPDPVLRKTGNRIDILHEIRRDAQVSACSKSRKAGVMRRKWKIEQRKSTPRAAEIAKAMFKRQLNLRNVMREMLDMWGYGYQVSEVVWERQGDLLLPARIVGKPPEWFVFGEDNELRQLRKTGMLSDPVEPHKFLLTQYEPTYSNPYGEAQYSLAFWPVTFKKGGLKFWAKFIEKFGMPHAIGKLPRGASISDRDDLLQKLMAMVQDAAAVFPDDSSVELLELNTAESGEMHERFARFFDEQISKAILSHGAAVDSTPGKLGGANGSMGVRADIIEDDSNILMDTMNKLIAWMHEFNPSTLGTDRPSFELYDEENVDVARAERDARLLNTQTVHLTKAYFTKRYDFDGEDLEVVAPVSVAASPAQSLELAAGTESLLQKQITPVLKPFINPVNGLQSELA